MLDEQKFKDMAQEIVDLVIRKNHDYGDSYFQIREDFGPASFIIRLADKFNRLQTLQSKPNKVEESIEDTIKDIMGYCLLELYYLQNQRNTIKEIK